MTFLARKPSDNDVNIISQLEKIGINSIKNERPYINN